MGRYGRRGIETHRQGRQRRAALLLAPLMLASLLFCWSPAAAAPEPKTETKVKKVSPAEIAPTLDRVVEAQRALAATLADLREQLTEMQRTTNELRDDSRQKHDAAQAVLEQISEQVEGMRREVWGLYVESSGLKNDIAQTGKQVEGLDQSLGSFRLSAGIVVAIVIVLQLVLVGLTFRGRS